MEKTVQATTDVILIHLDSVPPLQRDDIYLWTAEIFEFGKHEDCDIAHLVSLAENLLRKHKPLDTVSMFVGHRSPQTGR